jgi:hypothetical protein
MTEDEIKELSKMKSVDDCCPFCASRCIMCGSVNIAVRYMRLYKLENKRMTFESSTADVACFDCGGRYEVDIEMTEALEKEGALLDGGSVINEVRKYISNPKIAKQLDKLFVDYDTIKLNPSIQKKIAGKGLKYFFSVNEYENSERNSISIDYNDWLYVDETGTAIDDDEVGYLAGLIDFSELHIKFNEDPDDPANHNTIEITPIRL